MQTVKFLLIHKFIFLGDFPRANSKSCCHSWSQCSDLRVKICRCRKKQLPLCIRESHTGRTPILNSVVKQEKERVYGASQKRDVQNNFRDLDKVTCFLQKSRIEGHQVQLVLLMVLLYLNFKEQRQEREDSANPIQTRSIYLIGLKCLDVMVCSLRLDLPSILNVLHITAK